MKVHGMPMNVNETPIIEINDSPESIAWAVQRDAGPRLAPEEGRSENTDRYCVYNQSRERFVATEVATADGSDEDLEARLRALETQGCAALWIVAFRKIAPTSVRFPVDLVFLDDLLVVLNPVESFPMEPVGVSSSRAASVLVLPAGTLAQGEIRRGDQMVIAAPDQMKRHLQRVQREQVSTRDTAAINLGEKPPNGTAQQSEQANEPWMRAECVSEPAESGGNGPDETDPDLCEMREPDASSSDAATQWRNDAPKNWFLRLLLGDSPEPRKVTREALPGLIAYFFTGGAPVEHPVRDISTSGLYILTRERWYVGTVVRLTLTDQHRRTVERSITVNAKVVRSGNDGVGLEFILAGDARRHGRAFELTDQANGVGIADVEAFLRKFKES
jgi:hypothetical protein